MFQWLLFIFMKPEVSDASCERCLKHPGLGQSHAWRQRRAHPLPAQVPWLLDHWWPLTSAFLAALKVPTKQKSIRSCLEMSMISLQAVLYILHLISSDYIYIYIYIVIVVLYSHRERERERLIDCIVTCHMSRITWLNVGAPSREVLLANVLLFVEGLDWLSVYITLNTRKIWYKFAWKWSAPANVSHFSVLIGKGIFEI